MLIGLIGQSGGGKSTVAKILTERCGFTRLAFADFIREEIIEFISSPVSVIERLDERTPKTLRALLEIVWGLHHVSSNTKYFNIRDYLYSKPTSLPARLMLQLWGTEYRRGQYGDSYWTSLMCKKLFDTGDGVNIVIDDVRHPLEVDLIHGYTGAMIVDVWPGVPPVDLMQHSTEQVYADMRKQWADYVLLNPKPPADGDPTDTSFDTLTVSVAHMLDLISLRDRYYLKGQVF